MRFIAMHHRHGNIAGLTKLPSDGPGAARALEPGQAVTELEVAEGDLDVRSLETKHGAAETLRALRVDPKTEARLVSRREYEAG